MQSTIFSSVKKLLNSQFPKYFIAGVTSTLVDWLLFYLLAINLGFYYQFSLIVSFLSSSIINYTLNRKFTFQSKSKKIARQFSVYISIVLISLAASVLLMFVFVELLFMQKMLSRIITSFLLVFVNYLLHKNLTFNKKFFA